jgi:D-serine deaminase-like pyridoxal phosphate-dependent protein
MDLRSLTTPSLLLDEAAMQRNIDRLRARLAALGVRLRPHLKTCKSADIARRVMDSPSGPATVSTLKEAEQFAAAGVADLLYAVGIEPGKFERVARLHARGVDLAVVCDGGQAAAELAGFARATGLRVPVLIEVDSDGHRCGVRPDAAELLDVAAVLARDCELRGVMTHAGASYGRFDGPGQRAMAEQERQAAVSAAAALRAAGHLAPVVSVGSTPTAHFAASLEGVTEVRAGVFVFFDLVMAGLGVCTLDDVALSVMTSVIGHRRERGWIVVDAGWMALSRDRGTASHPVDQGYGLACDAQGRPLEDLIVVEASQEHGILALRPGSDAALPDLPVGTRLRILPNHACATAAQHDRYHVVSGGEVVAEWARFSGW